jgi:ATP-dependent Clp protease ATP-binding subunit ClpA
MQREIEDRLANLLLAGQVVDGAAVVVDVDDQNQGLTVSAK